METYLNCEVLFVCFLFYETFVGGTIHLSKKAGKCTQIRAKEGLELGWVVVYTLIPAQFLLFPVLCVCRRVTGITNVVSPSEI